MRVLDRTDCSKYFETSIINVPVERDFYTVETKNGKSQRIESELIRTIESDAARVIDRMIRGSFSPNDLDRWHVSAFVALQSLRGWGTREQIRMIGEHLATLHVVNTTRKSIRRYYREIEKREATENEVENIVAFASNPNRYNIIVHKNELIRNTIQILPGLTVLFYARKWRLISSLKARFLTSDSPVIRWSLPDRSRFGVGLGSADKIGFAVDRERALILTHQSLSRREGKRLASEQEVFVFNTYTAANARRWIIHHPADNPPFDKALPALRPQIGFGGKPSRIVPDGEGRRL